MTEKPPRRRTMSRARVTENRRQTGLRNARTWLRAAERALNNAHGELDAIVTTDEDRQAADEIEIALNAIDLIEIPDPDDDSDDDVGLTNDLETDDA